jgi:hypothetical protein
MERETPQDGEKATGQRFGRPWTERFSGPIRYRRTSDLIGTDRRIVFEFFLQPGQQTIDPAVRQILNRMKYLDRNPNGEHGNRPQPTGLKSSRHGTRWDIADTPTGRMVADIIDAKLRDLAATLEQGSEPGHHR